MIQLLLIALGSAVGGVCRYLLSTSVYNILGRDFPYGTLCVNLLGSFAIGFLSILFIERFAILDTTLRALLIVGFLGGFTTFSSFSLESFYLFESGQILHAIFNITMSVVGCITLSGFGALLARQL